jgi:hypothetical protein
MPGSWFCLLAQQGPRFILDEKIIFFRKCKMIFDPSEERLGCLLDPRIFEKACNRIADDCPAGARRRAGKNFFAPVPLQRHLAVLKSSLLV